MGDSTFQMNFSRDGYYVVRPDHRSITEVEWHNHDKPLDIRALYGLIGNGCDTVERVQLAERGFDVHRDPGYIMGMRFDPRGALVDAWADEEGMRRQQFNPVATALCSALGYISTTNGIFGAIVIACGKAGVE